MLVHDVMSKAVETIHREEELRAAVGRFLAEDVGSLVVVDDEENPIGLLTERDVLQALYREDDHVNELPVSAIAHRPVMTTSPDTTVQYVADRMAREDVKKVPVVDDLDLVGIVTLTDVVDHLSDLRREATAHAEGSGEWNRGT